MKFYITIASVFFFLFVDSHSQNNSIDLMRLESTLDSIITAKMQQDHIPGAALIIIKDRKTILKRGYGYTELGENIRNVSPDSTIFRIGSITKTFTAMAVMQLVDRGLIDLHTDVNTYLTSIQVPETYKQPITAAHLLNHSAGFDELPGRSTFDGGQRIPLKQFLRDRLVRIRQPGLISSYSSYGIALAGLLVEDVTKMPLNVYLETNVWKPLDMNMTSMFLNEQVEQYASWGYEYRNGVNIPQPWEYYHTYPASDINSTASDMAKYMVCLLDDGKFQEKTILSKSSANAMKTGQLKVHPEIATFTYGLYEDYIAGLATIGHGGDMLGYSGFMTLIPQFNMGIYIVHHHEGTRLRYDVIDAVVAHLTDTSPETYTTPQLRSDLSKYSGRYRWATYCHTCTNSWQPETHSLVVNGDSFTFMDRTYYEIKPMVFKSSDGSRTMSFLQDNLGNITYLSLGNTGVFERVLD